MPFEDEASRFIMDKPYLDNQIARLLTNAAPTIRPCIGQGPGSGAVFRFPPARSLGGKEIVGLP